MTCRTNSSPNNHHTFTPINLSDFTTTDYNNTTVCVVVMLDHSRVFRVTVPDAVYIQCDLLKMSIIMFETCRGL
jgi:hypothetical protein